jgi:hypothetical protein
MCVARVLSCCNCSIPDLAWARQPQELASGLMAFRRRLVPKGHGSWPKAALIAGTFCSTLAAAMSAFVSPATQFPKISKVARPWALQISRSKAPPRPPRILRPPSSLSPRSALTGAMAPICPTSSSQAGGFRGRQSLRGVTHAESHSGARLPAQSLARFVLDRHQLGVAP